MAAVTALVPADSVITNAACRLGEYRDVMEPGAVDPLGVGLLAGFFAVC